MEVRFYVLWIILWIWLYIVIQKKKQIIQRERQKEDNRKKLMKLAEKMLDRQIEILIGGDFKTITFELEMSKFIKDCLLYDLAEGKYSKADVWKAHFWLRDAFKEEFSIFTDTNNEDAKRDLFDYLEDRRIKKDQLTGCSQIYCPGTDFLSISDFQYQRELKEFLFYISNRIEYASGLEQKKIIEKIKNEYNILYKELESISLQYYNVEKHSFEEQYYELTRKYRPALHSCSIIISHFENQDMYYWKKNALKQQNVKGRTTQF